MPNLVDAAFVFSSLMLGLAAIIVAHAFADWVRHEIHKHRS